MTDFKNGQELLKAVFDLRSDETAGDRRHILHKKRSGR